MEELVGEEGGGRRSFAGSSISRFLYQHSLIAAEIPVLGREISQRERERERGVLLLLLLLLLLVVVVLLMTVLFVVCSLL